MTTVTETAGVAVATADETRPTRLATAVQLAVLCRDNNLDWPRKMFFSDDYPDQLHLYTSTVTQMWALANVMGASVQPTTRTTGTDGEYAHHHASGIWLGFRVSVTCLETLPADPAPVDAATSAAIDALVATVNTERVEVGADGCGCPITEEIRANGSSVEGTERVEHRARCWNAPAGTHEEAVAR